MDILKELVVKLENIEALLLTQKNVLNVSEVLLAYELVRQRQCSFFFAWGIYINRRCQYYYQKENRLYNHAKCCWYERRLFE